MKSYLKAIFSLNWFYKSWWQYLLEKPDKGSEKWLYDRWKTVYKWRRFWCRARGHPDGVWWFNVNGYEPDMRCKNCGDYLG